MVSRSSGRSSVLRLNPSMMRLGADVKSPAGGIWWDDVMSYQVHDDRIVIVESPVGFKRTWWFPASGHEAK